LAQLPVTADQRVGRAVMGELGIGGTLQLGNDAHRENLAELHAPLVERVDSPDRPLGENVVLVKRHQPSERRRRQTVEHQEVGGSITLEDPVGNKRRRSALGANLLGRLPESERLRLREHIGDQNIVMAAERVQGLSESEQVHWDETGALMDKLVKGVLAGATRLAPVDWAGVVVDRLALQRYPL